MRTKNLSALTAFEKGRFNRFIGKHKTTSESAKAFGLSEEEYLRYKSLGRAKTKTVTSIRSVLSGAKGI